MVTSVSQSKSSRSVRSKHHSKGADVLYSETEKKRLLYCRQYRVVTSRICVCTSLLPCVSITSFQSLWVIVSMVLYKAFQLSQIGFLVIEIVSY